MRKFVKQRLLETDTSLTELAEEMGYTRVNVYAIMKGSWSRRSIENMAEKLDVHPLDLLTAYYEAYPYDITDGWITHF